ncbi:VQ motif-containing protein 22-like [Phalaenopsis equestris]|uniref:VQ motif-containing protein 22-like n=1 Tax=Phalaenopsis equestris TaxID=78828 RepID=UPI0009E397F5|nr:VQ motif-containing protein 22-like [Phalaenopsis equestris]
MADGSVEPAHWAQFQYQSTTSMAVNSARSTNGQPATKPARKRSRSTRRVPTTLLKTDTSNFRAMVQQFTGVPSAPYISGGSSTISFGFNSAIRQSTSVLPRFDLHQQQFNTFFPAQQQQDIMGCPIDYENMEEEIFHGMNSTGAAGRLPELLEGFFDDGNIGGLPPATVYEHSDGYFL